MKRRRLVIPICLLLVLSAVRVSGQSEAELKATRWTDSYGLFTELMVSVAPAARGNEYFPPMASNKLAWILEESYQGRLILDFHGENLDLNQPNILMQAGYEGGKPYVRISAPALWHWVREVSNVPKGFNQEIKHDFLIGVVHQAVHLEHPTDVLYKLASSPESWAIEETRAWREVVMGVVAPLRSQNQSVGTVFVQAHELLKKCAEPHDCPAFEKYVSVR